MRHPLLPLALLLTALWGCSGPPITAPPPEEATPVTVWRHVAYGADAAEVLRAYRAAAVERGLRILAETPHELTASAGPPAADGLGVVRIEVAPSDTLRTRVSVSHRYRGGAPPTHYPFELSVHAFRHFPSPPSVAALDERVYPGPDAACPPPVSAEEGMEPPRIVGGPAALLRRVVYTPEARRHGVEGVVYLAAVVDASGRVACADVISGLPYGLTEAAVAALVGSRFEPAQREGTAVPTRIVQPVRFRLTD